MKLRYIIALTTLALVACSISALAITGHILHIAKFHTWKDGTPAMAINTAICIFSLGLALFLNTILQIRK